MMGLCLGFLGCTPQRISTANVDWLVFEYREIPANALDSLFLHRAPHNFDQTFYRIQISRRTDAKAMEREGLLQKAEELTSINSAKVSPTLDRNFLSESIDDGIPPDATFAQRVNPQPKTLNPQSSILNPQSSTLNPQSSILNPHPSTLIT